MPRCCAQSAKNTPLDGVLTETDCPYLTPVPHWGKRNEPAYVTQVAKQLASIHFDLSLDEIAHRRQATIQNRASCNLCFVICSFHQTAISNFFESHLLRNFLHYEIA